MGHPRITYSVGEQVLPPLHGRRLLAHIVVNVEVWPLGAAMPRQLVTTPHGVAADPDMPNFCWAEYGMRRGLPRLARMLRARDIPASANMNAAVIDEYPEAAELVAEQGWEWVAHGVRQRSVQQVPDERSFVRESLHRIAAYTSVRPRGWLGPGQQQSYDTPDILSEEGVDYMLDLTLDDLPLWVTTSSKPLLAVPYSLELNDSVLHAVQQQPSDEIYTRVADTLAVFEQEVESTVRIMTMPVHPHIMGVPHRALHLARTLDLLADHGVGWVTGSEIADWYTAAVPPPASSAPRDDVSPS